MALFDFSGVLVAPGDFSTAFNFANLGATLTVESGDAASFRAENDDDTVSATDFDAFEIFVDDAGVLRDPVEEIAFYTFTEATTNAVVSVMLILRPDNQYIALAYDPTSGTILDTPIAPGDYRVTGPDEVVTPVSLVPDTTNGDPVAGDDSFEVDEDGTVAGNVLGNDSDPDGDPLTLRLVSGPDSGAIIFSDDGSFQFWPNDDFNGADGFVYEISDGIGTPATATVSLTVRAQNDLPVARNDSYAVKSGETLTVAALAGLLANDTDIDGDALVVSQVDAAANGTLLVAPDGSLSYTPDTGFVGTETVGYTLSDGTATATATLVIEVQNIAPEITSPDAFDTTENQTAVGTVVGLDGDGDALDYAILGGPDAGFFDIDAGTGALSFKVAPDFETPLDADGDNIYALTIGVSDGTETVEQAVTVTVGNAFEGSGPLLVAVAPEVAVEGTGADELFLAEAANSYVVGDGGTDVFVLDFTPGNGRETAHILTYDPAQDSIDLGGAPLLTVGTSGDAFVLVIDNGEYDALVVQGVGSFDELVFV